MTTGSSKSNHHSFHPRDDREALSALFDGALPADAARFALRRLDHDAEWREACGRWQLIGDTLRGGAAVVAPAHFAAGVMRALAAEKQAADAVADAVTPTMAVASHAHRRRWLGGAALAASVAVAAVLVVRPYSQPSTEVPGGRMAAEVALPAPVAGVSKAPAAATTAAPVQAVATTEVAPVGTATHPGRISRPVPRTSRNPVPPSSPGTPMGEVASAVASAAPARTDHQPFHPPADDIVTRPWPRSVLSDGTAAGALTVDFSSAPASPSLYPFEPRLQETQAARPQPADPQR